MSLNVLVHWVGVHGRRAYHSFPFNISTSLFFFDNSNSLTFIAQYDQIITWLNIKYFSCFCRYHNLTFLSHFRDSKNMLSLWWNTQTKIIAVFSVIIYQFIQTYIQYFCQELTPLNIR